MNNRSTKLILIFIALGLWANAAITIMRPAPAAADAESELRSIDSRLSSIGDDIGRIQRGTCSNSKLC